jgi:hypothetical protein
LDLTVSLRIAGAAGAAPRHHLNTSATDYRPIKDGYMVEFRDGRFVVVSELLHGN